jgi:7-carboxy-7-deazaguanine synthase
MFGLNSIVGPKHFNDAPADSLKVTSRFLTIQGEGVFASRVAYFIRLTHCSLACSWCDAFFDEGDWMTFDEIEADIEQQISNYFHGEVPEYATHSSELVTWPSGISKQMPRKRKEMVLVITGGEPMLQKNLGPFLKRMQDIFEHTQIESNGTYLQDIPNSTVLMVSPKCSEKNGVPVRYLKPRTEVLERATALKFVVTADPESKYHNIPAWAYEWHRQTKKDVYISPMNIYNDLPEKAKKIRDGRNHIEIEDRSTADEVVSFLNMSENQKNHEYAGKMCIQHGFVLNLQQHLYISVA